MNRAQALQLSLVFALKTLAGESSCGTPEENRCLTSSSKSGSLPFRFIRLAGKNLAQGEDPQLQQTFEKIRAGHAVSVPA